MHFSPMPPDDRLAMSIWRRCARTMGTNPSLVAVLVICATGFSIRLRRPVRTKILLSVSSCVAVKI
ncbi:hypothetical protein ALP14_200023 [Pseudomonas amygdali pv. myricae]|uniref:Uncharacterized protein n=1 Tax=Pseudomonas savastanoi TaxID=29438 RepID=A0A3M5GGX8_PSESS|nr:hypothetical protein ALQ66_200099 [Pseudomonas savastanoi pv. glycinea]RMS85293.1 hypothetical protein ALP59_200064 [Pseudomonas savastanoi]RMU24733.1 hypothetical protein ALP31_200186 [Pseudomonas amygdali pv. morsprunorum]RMU95529.1 hypothetical protein ALP18_200238 [Pseudomonas amygdali pv. myricae]RMV22973.1 hypothetical protein ALP14_200023 [Pseudomonas amygdali pv. myricae]